MPLLALAMDGQDWSSYGGPGALRYSPLSQINRSNVTKLKVAWTHRHGDVVPKKSAFQANPILADGVLYVPTPFNRILALEPESGRLKWAFDPQLDRAKAGGDGFVCRGVATWKDPQTRLRFVYVATLDARLIAVNAEDGKAVWSVQLGNDVGAQYAGEYHITSPPVVLNGRVIVGSAIDDNSRVKMASGVVRAFDAKTGKQLWHWDPIPRELNAGAANAWSVMSADEARDLVFIPTGSASPDHWGGERAGDNRWANSTVALDGKTGEVKWAFQTVHHDTWDYDVPAQPLLIDWKGTPAVVQPTKTGQFFVFHRDTGSPVFPIAERPVPQGGVPGEKLSPTQPFSSLPPIVSHAPVTVQDAWGVAYFDRKNCEQKIASYRSEGIFTPLSTQGTIVSPGIAGGTNWGSAAFDPARGLLIANATNMPFVIKLAPRDQADQLRKDHPGWEFMGLRGTPYVGVRKGLLSQWDLPCVKPPWGTLTALDLNTRTIKWQVPLGTPRDLAPVPVSFAWGTPSMGGPLATGGGLVFIGAAMDNYLRAFDTDTGREVWKERLPAGAQSTPMTYERNGKQYVVVAVGGHGKLGTTQGDYVIAYALP
jgi:quinoprotein glucose dehydrogenase